MEAVPRLPMIWFQLKVSPEPTAFGPKLKQYIRDFYNEDPESYSNEIHQLENLRAMAVRPPIAVTGCSLLKKYYCQLHFVQSRFPMGTDEPAAVSFAWRDAYANMVFSLSNIRFEIISILYNIGAIHTQLGAKTERTSADGMKMACSHFQCAAWAFEHLQNSYPQPPGVDMSPDLMKFMNQLCLAQAQECILEKSMLDNRKPTIVAKVAKQIVDYYALALRTVESNNSEDNAIVDTVGSKFYKTLKSYVKFKRAYYMAVTLLYQGLASEEQQKMGERVAFYNAALASLNAARSIHTGVKSSTGITGIAGEKEAIEEALVFTNDVIEGKRKAAKNENEFIYHEEVPDKDTLPTVNGASLVKGISFNVNDPEISGPDIFARLIPMKVHEASSLYSEEKAKILRLVGTKIEEKDQALEMYLASLKLQHLGLYDPDSSSLDPDNLPLPEELAERCAALNAKPNAIQELEDIMQKLSSTYGDVEAMLKDIDKLLTEEDQKEKQYQETVGKRPPSIVATDLTREAKKYEEAHAKASESNQALHRAMALHLNNLQVLSQPLNELMATIPSTSGAAKIESEVEKQNVRELKRILGKVEEMQRQRGELHAKLRDSISQDNLTRILVTATAESTPLDTLFSEQLAKHQSLRNLIDQNLAAQDNVLSALTDAYARTAETRKSVEEVIKRRDLMISSLIASYDAYEDLLAKSSKGLEFYRKLEVNVTKLLQRVKSTCRVQEEEREQILARNGKDGGVDPTISVPEKKVGSGMKLRDHLANRLKNNATYPVPYSDKQTIPIAPVQPNAHAPVPQYSSDKIVGPDGIPVHAVPPVAADPQLQDPSMYQYYPYSNYYMGQRNPYGSQPYGSHDANPYNGMNMSLPRSGTTNSDHMYHQAGVTSSTEVASTNVQYAGYNNVRNDQAPVPLTNQGHYPTHTGYEEANSFPQYPTYTPAQGYHMPNATYTNVQGPQLNYTQPHVPANIPPSQSPSHMAVSNQQVGQPQAPNIPQNSAPQLSNAPQQYEPAMQVTNRIAYGQEYHTVVQNDPSSTLTSTNYPIVNEEASSTIPLTNQPQPQMYRPSDTTNLQYVPPNPQQTSAAPAVNSNYAVQTQYLPPQATGVVPNDPSMRTTYSGSPSNIPQQSSIEQQSLYYYQQNPQSNTIQPTTAYILPSQQGYIDQNSAVVQPSVPNSQVPMTPPVQTYPNAYGQTYPVDTNGHQYQMHQVQSTSLTNQSLGMNYGNDPEIIQSHTKSSSIQGYLQNYQYSVQDPQSGIIQYSNYPQGYTNTWDNKQLHNSMSDSYKGHPGYSYDATAGNYQYSSGYQDSRIGSQQTPIEAASSQASSHYTNANNAATTNLTTSSQYSNGSYQPSADGQNYYNSSYEAQVPAEGAVVTNNVTNTNGQQTYTQSSNNATTTTAKAETEKSDKVSNKIKSNLDLLADLDITINHAPLVPVVPLSDKESKDVTTSSTPDIPEESSDKSENDVANSQIDDKHENLQIVWDTWYNDVQPKKDPLGDPLILQKFITDIEKYEKFVDSLTVKTLSGSTNLDIKWKEIQEFEEREFKKQTSNAAITHASENRSSDWVPYDTTRVKLTAVDRSSDYINASYVKDLTQWTPTFIVTQAPKSQSFEAFWTMIWEQGSEVIACLCNDTQLNGDIYWPTNKEINLNIGNFTLSLKNSSTHTTHVQRVISIVHSERKKEKIVVHMQYLGWPSNELPSSPGPLLSFATDIMSEQALRHCPKPIVIHCSVGGPLSSIFLLAAATVCHVRAGHGVIDVPLVLSTLVKYRRCLINKELLLFSYRMVRYHAQDTLMKRGILSSTKSTFDGFDGMKGKPVNKHCHPSDDFLHNLGVGIQHGLARQSGKEQTTGPSQTTVAVKSEEKTDRAKPVDPLSQLDPLWSIRR